MLPRITFVRLGDTVSRTQQVSALSQDTHLPLTPVLRSLRNRKAFPMVSTFHVPTPYGDFKNGGEPLTSCVTITHLTRV